MRDSRYLKAALETIFVDESCVGRTDGELLDWIAIGSSDSAKAAFNALVARHGPMVRRACHMWLDSDNDVEDAFQATFLILARKHRKIRRRDTVNLWLYGTAHKVCLKARQHAARKRKIERSYAEMMSACGREVSPLDSLLKEELRLEVLREIDQLPKKYQEVLKLRYEKSLTNAGIAKALGRNRNTVGWHLVIAEKKLKERLSPRVLGSPLAVPVVGRVLEVPATLARSTVSAAMRVARGGPVKSAKATSGRMLDTGAVSADAVSLAEAVLRSTTRTSWLIGAKFVAIVAVALLVIGLTGQPWHTASSLPSSFAQSAGASSNLRPGLVFVFGKPLGELEDSLLKRSVRGDISWVAIGSGETVLSSGPQATIGPHVALNLSVATRRAGDRNERERTLERKRAGRRGGGVFGKIARNMPQKRMHAFGRSAAPLMRELEWYLKTNPKFRGDMLVLDLEHRYLKTNSKFRGDMFVFDLEHMRFELLGPHLELAPVGHQGRWLLVEAVVIHHDSSSDHFSSDDFDDQGFFADDFYASRFKNRLTARDLFNARLEWAEFRIRILDTSLRLAELRNRILERLSRIKIPQKLANARQSPASSLKASLDGRELRF